MDSFAQLALMAKAKRVFESSETFLSFPALSPLSYLPDELRFGNAAEMTTEDLLEASEFSRTANQVPRSIIAPIDEGEYLWDVYQDILQTATVASGSMSATEQTAYNTALALLYNATPDGLRTDSERSRTYKQHRDGLFEAQEDYRNQQMTAEASTDPAVTARWKNEEEPLLRQVLLQRETDWATNGFKAEIEGALQVEAAGAARAPSTSWSEWQRSFIDDVDLLTDTNQIRFAITGYSPYDTFESDNWNRFTLTRDEMTKLAEQAPQELRDIFQSGAGATEIESVSFEYRSVAVTRPWFRPAVFKARFWRLPEGSEPISEGPASPDGRCPAYVTALVFARNVVVKHRESAGGAVEGVGIKAFKLNATQLNPELMQLALRAKPTRVRVRDHRREAPATPAVDTDRAALRLKTIGFAQARPAASVAAISAIRQPLAGVRLHRLETTRPIVATGVLIATAPPPEPAPPEPEPAPTRTGEVIVLAFICKRVPRSPDPDQSLSWD